MSQAGELTTELKQRLLKTWAERSRLRAIELVEAELGASHVEAIAIIDSLEPEYLRHIKAPRIGNWRIDINLGFGDFELIGMSLVLLAMFGVFLIWVAGGSLVAFGGFVIAVVLIVAVAFVVGSGFGGG